MKSLRFMPVLAALLIAAGLIACNPPAPAPVEEPKTLENGEYTFEHDGVTTRYAIHGDGPVCMVVSNAWGITIEGLRGVFGDMESYLKLVYFDPRGMGGSSAAVQDTDLSMEAVRADLEALRQHLNLGKANLIGWSNGAMNLMLFAAEYPESCERIILLHGAAYNDPGDMQYFQENYPVLFQNFGTLMQRMAEPQMTPETQNAEFRQFLIETWFPHLFADHEAGRSHLDRIFKDGEFSWRHMQYTQSIPVFDAREGLKTVTCPALVIAGAHDMLPAARVEEVANLIPGAQYVLFENSGHFSMLEESEKFHTTLKEFMGLNR